MQLCAATDIEADGGVLVPPRRRVPRRQFFDANSRRCTLLAHSGSAVGPRRLPNITTKRTLGRLMAGAFIEFRA